MAKSSSAAADDPMDLGPFLQNFVMQNPFRVAQQQHASTRVAAAEGPREDHPRAARRWTLRPRRRPRASNGCSGAGDGGGGLIVDLPSSGNGDQTNSHHKDDNDVTAWSVTSMSSLLCPDLEFSA